MALTKIHDIHPTPFTTRHDVALSWNKSMLRLAWLHYDVDRDTDGDLLTSFWVYNANQEPLWKPPYPLSQEARTGPSLIDGTHTHFKSGYLFAFADGDGNIRVVWRDDPFAEEIPLGETTNDRPTLAVAPDRIWLAWTGVEHSLNTMFAKQRLDFIGKVTYADKSEHSPGLRSDDIHLGLAWSGMDDRRSLNIAHVEDGVLSDKYRLSEYDSCSSGPALDSREGVFYAAWGSASTHEICMLSGLWKAPDFERNDARTQHGPGLAYPYIAWADESYTIQLGKYV